MNYKKIFKDKNLTNVDEFFTFIQNNFKYGWIDNKGKTHFGVNDAESYSLQAPPELFKSRIGNCWDMVELYRCFFDNMTSLKHETYYLFYDDGLGCPSHVIFVFYDNDEVYWFEPMFNDSSYYYSGIHKYTNLSSLFIDVKKVFIEKSLLNKSIPGNYNSKNFYLFKYEKPEYHINGLEFRNHINNSILINIEEVDEAHE